ncbi:MAG: CHAT domain-containing protein [Adhaeribacter sp.]
MNQRRLKIGIKCILLTFLIGWVNNGFAQQPTYKQAKQLCEQAYTLLFEQGNDSLALQKYHAAKAIYTGQRQPDLNLVDACFGLGIIYQMRGNYRQAIKNYQESVAYEKNINPQADSSSFYPLVLISESYIHLNHYDSAYTAYEKAARVLAKYPHIPSVYAMRFYNGLGSLYYLFGNYAQSINYYEKILKILAPDGKAPQPANSDQVTRYVMYSNNIASAHRKLGLYQPAINKIKGLLRYNIISNILYQNMATAYLQLNKPDSAKTYLQKIKLKNIPDGASLDATAEEIDYYNSFGAVYLKTKNYSQALKSFNQAQEICLSRLNAKNDGLAMAYAGKGQVYAAQKQYLPALKQYQLALQSLHFTSNNTNIYQNPEDFRNVIAPLLYFEILISKAEAFRQYFAQTHHLTDLEAALKTYQVAFGLAAHIRKGFDSDEAKLFLTNTVAPAYEEAIATGFALFTRTNQSHYLQVAFALAEENKAAVLAESLRDLEIKKIPGISQALLRQEANLKRSNAALLVKLAEDTVSSARREMYRTYIRENEIKLAKIYKDFEKNKRYYALKYDTKPLNISQVQAELHGKTAVVEYFIGKKHLYAFVISQDNFTAKRIGNTVDFTQNWQKLYAALYQAKPGYRYQGNDAAHQLYQQLLAPLTPAIAQKERLLIIPDKALCYLPFEALVPDVNNSRYLIQDYTVSYAYSAKLLHPVSESSVNKHAVSVLAMAPFGEISRQVNNTTRANLLAPLLASAGEVENIGGQVYIGKEATKERLQQLVRRFDIVHLATHAKADNQDPLQSYIAFYQHNLQNSSRLYASEIYNLPLSKLKLVVLSACETGNGKLVNGEGIMSLARAFAYAGCASIITTLWQAEDNATAFITTRLHNYLKRGKSKDEALRLAKLDYLESQTNSRQQSPVYWANFVFIGDEAPVYPGNIPLGWVLGATAISMLTGWLLYKRRQRKNQVAVNA